MADLERIEQRLAAVERTVTGDDVDLTELGKVAERLEELETVRAQLEDLSERVAALEADVEALGGYASEVDSVNTDVERQAYAAFATVDRLEERIDEVDDRLETVEATDHVTSASNDEGSGVGAAEAAKTTQDETDGTVAGSDGTAAESNAPSAAADSTSEAATSDSTNGSMGPFIPAEANETPEGGAATDEPSLTAAVRRAERDGADATENADRTSADDADRPFDGSTDRSSVDGLFEGTGAADDPEQASDDDDGGFIDALRAKLS